MRPNKLQAYPDPPLLVGLYFSLGHSTVVVLMCVGVALGSAYLSDNVSNLKEVLAPIGTTISAAVLLLVSVLNFAVARNLIMERHEKKVKGEHKHYSTFGGTFFTHKVRPSSHPTVVINTNLSLRSSAASLAPIVAHDQYIRRRRGGKRHRVGRHWRHHNPLLPQHFRRHRRPLEDVPYRVPFWAGLRHRQRGRPAGPHRHVLFQ